MRKVDVRPVPPAFGVSAYAAESAQPFVRLPQPFRVLVIGCGSIGARRARLLAAMGHDVDGIDGCPARAACATFGRGVTWRKVLDQPHDAAFICTPAETHVPLALDCLRAGVRAVFIEKPLAPTLDGLDELERAAEGHPVMVGCNMRFAYGDVPRPTSWLVAAQSKPLATWRPGAEQAYRANGLLLEAGVHELDLAYWLAGPGKVVGAEWQGPDTCTVKLEHEGGALSNVYVSWAEGAPTVRWLRTDATPAAIVPDTSDAMYVAEMRHFLGCVETGARPCNMLADARHVLGWALAANALREAA